MEIRMDMYTYEDVEQTFAKHKHKVTHYIVAQTHFRPCNHDEKRIAQMAAQAKKNLRHALNHFAADMNIGVSRSMVQRKPHIYRPLSFVTIESLSPSLLSKHTIHFNILLGNLDPRFSTEEIGEKFRKCWVDKVKQKDLVHTQEYDGRANLLSYCIKEEKQSHNLESTELSNWDIENCFVPKFPVFVD
jgi:hypothetical protein